jgi:hypothetical protein
MKTKHLFNAGLLIGSALLAQPASAQFQLMDNFSTYTDGPLAGQGGWQSPTGNGVTVSSGTAVIGDPGLVNPTYDALPVAIPHSSTAATFFMQFSLSGVTTTGNGNNFNFELTQQSAPTDLSGSAQVQFNYDSTSSRLPALRNGGSFAQISINGTSVYTPLADAVYSLWFVVNNSAGTYQAYLQGGDVTTQTLLQSTTGVSTFTFRTATANPLVAFNMGEGGTVGNTDPQTLYDLFEDPNGANLTDPGLPTPEPGTFALLGLSVLLPAYKLGRRFIK